MALTGAPVVCALTLWRDLVVGGAPWESGFPPLGPTLLLLLLAWGSALVACAAGGAAGARGLLVTARKPSP